MKKIYYYEHKRHGGLLEQTKKLNDPNWIELTEEQYEKAYARAYQIRLDFGY